MQGTVVSASGLVTDRVGGHAVGWQLWVGQEEALPTDDGCVILS